MQNIPKLCSQVTHLKLNSSAINHTLIIIFLKNVCIGLVSKTKLLCHKSYFDSNISQKIVYRSSIQNTTLHSDINPTLNVKHSLNVFIGHTNKTKKLCHKSYFDCNISQKCVYRSSKKRNHPICHKSYFQFKTFLNCVNWQKLLSPGTLFIIKKNYNDF